jgi:hypothetical protein
MSREDHDLTNVIRLADRRVRLHARTATSEPDCELTADVDEEGLSLRDPGDVELGRYIWLDFDLADGDEEPVRALGEVLPRRDAMGVALDIKFKHLFPDHKRRLLVALGKAGRG